MGDNLKAVLWIMGALAGLFTVGFGAVTYFTPVKTFEVVTEEIRTEVAGLKLSDQAQGVEQAINWAQERLNRLEERKEGREEKNLAPRPSYKPRKRELEQRLQRLELDREKIYRKQLEKRGK